MVEGVLASSGNLIAEHDPQFVPLAAIRHNEGRWQGRAGEVTIRSAAPCRASHDSGPCNRNDRDLNAVIATAMAIDRSCSRESYMSGALSVEVK